MYQEVPGEPPPVVDLNPDLDRFLPVQEMRVQWDDFLDKYLERLSRWTFSPGDLRANEFRRVVTRLKDEYSGERKEVMQLDANGKGELDFLGVISTGGEGTLGVRTEDFEKVISNQDHYVEWDGQVVVPRTVAIVDLQDVLARMEGVMDTIASVATPERRSRTLPVSYVPVDGGFEGASVQF